MAQTTLGLLGPFHHGRGYRSPVSATSPSAGANYSYTVPGNAWQRLIACTFTLTTSSAVANRIVTVDYGAPDTGKFLSDGAAVIQTASGTGVFYGSNQRTNSEWNTGTATFFPLWGGFLESGQTVGITVANIDTADTLTGIFLTFETFEVGNEGYMVGGISTDDYDLPATVLPAG